MLISEAYRLPANLPLPLPALQEEHMAFLSIYIALTNTFTKMSQTTCG